MATTTTSAKDLDRCAEVCHECQDACLGLIPHCLELGGPHASPEHIAVLMDCAAICAASHNLLHRHSHHHQHTCRACAAICDACAADCRRLANGDAQMGRCADVCLRCAESCRHMSE